MLLKASSITWSDTELWKYKAFSSFKSIITRDSFPCYFASTSLRRDTLRFCFIDAIDREESGKCLYENVLKYLELVSGLDEKSEAYTLLVAIFDKKEDKISSDNDCRQTAFELLQSIYDLSGVDQGESEAEDCEWSLLIHGVPVFVLVGCPHYKNRNSRNLGEYFSLVIQTRKGIEYITRSKEGENSVRSGIRDRVNEYDNIPLSKNMLTHGVQGNADWKQYFLFDNNDEELKQCPIKMGGDTSN